MSGDFHHVMMRFDALTGEAEIQGRVRVKGLRVVHETLNGEGKHIYVLRVPGHSYRSLASSRRAPAAFEVLQEDYLDTHLDRDRREEDAPWISCTRVVHFNVMAGTKLT